MARKFSKEYKHMCGLHKQKLMHLAAGAADDPFDYGPGLEFFVQHLRFMRDYYKLGENVWAMEKKDEDPKEFGHIPTRYESLNAAIEQYDIWQDYTWKDWKVCKEAKAKFFQIVAENIEQWWD